MLKEINGWEETRDLGRSLFIENVTDSIRRIVNLFVSSHPNYYICDDDTNKKTIRLCKKQLRCVK
jgi:hypothetical protein